MCEDFELYVRDLVGRRSAADAAPMRILAFFSESDMMIGKGGQRYFEECFRNVDMEGGMQFETFTIPGTNHETLVSPQKEAWGRILEEIAKSG